MKRSNSEQSERSNLSFWDHLDELRSVLLKSLAAWLVGVVVAFCLKEPLFDLIFRPLQQGQQLINIDVTGQFMTHVQVSLWAGFVLALPFIVYWLYGFVAPALYEREKRYGIALVVCATALFVLGVVLDYFVIFPFSYRFLSGYQVTGLVENKISLSSYISLFIVLALLMGLLFEVPVITWFLAKMGILNAQHLRKGRKYVFVAILILAAVITPTGDPVTLMLVTMPVYGLYELSILIVN